MGKDGMPAEHAVLGQDAGVGVAGSFFLPVEGMAMIRGGGAAGAVAGLGLVAGSGPTRAADEDLLTTGIRGTVDTTLAAYRGGYRGGFSGGGYRGGFSGGGYRGGYRGGYY